ncbi:pentapeptide repeat-containing protein [Burkholderia guangdongensis]|uniref:pentapeptide repeat-containing protein n=1 Tax=Burkholderia guangdongensis TaxID=1792500 RepID=UPI0031B58787
MIYEGCHFDHLTWSDCRMSNVNFVDCRFDGNRFERCEAIRIHHENCRVIETTWDDCRLRGLSLTGGEIRGAEWRGGQVRDSIFSKTDGVDWHFERVRTAHVSFVASHLANVTLNGGHWSDTSWIDVASADLGIRSAELVNFIVGKSRCNRHAIEHCRGINVRWIDSQIEGMIVRECDLRQAAWSHCTWTEGRIDESRLPFASFDHAKVRGLSVSGTDLTQAIFDHAVLADCDLQRLHAPRVAFRHARLLRVKLTGARLERLDARGAELETVDLNGCDCRAGLLTGQPRRAWLAADTRQAIFEHAFADDDDAWQRRVQPGARGE